MGDVRQGTRSRVRGDGCGRWVDVGLRSRSDPWRDSGDLLLLRSLHGGVAGCERGVEGYGRLAVEVKALWTLT